MVGPLAVRNSARHISRHRTCLPPPHLAATAALAAASPLVKREGPKSTVNGQRLPFGGYLHGLHCGSLQRPRPSGKPPNLEADAKSHSWDG